MIDEKHPDNDESDDDAGMYDLAPDEPLKVSENAPAPLASPKAESPVTLGYQTARKVGVDLSDKSDPEAIKNFYMPIWLLGGGVAIELVAALFSRDVGAAFVQLGLQIIFGTAVMLVGILLAVRWRGIKLGSFWFAVLKLSAISVAPAAVVTFISPVLNLVSFSIPVLWVGISLAGLIGWGIQFVLYFALLGALFDLDESETWYCVWVIFLVRVGVYFCWLGVGKSW